MLTFQEHLSYNQMSILEKALAAVYLLIKLSENWNWDCFIRAKGVRGCKEVKEMDFIK
jgi:hypothetical protein